MAIEKIRSMSKEDMKGEQARIAEQIFRVRFAKGLGKQDGVGKMGDLKKDIARMHTITRERQLAQQKAGK